MRSPPPCALGHAIRNTERGHQMVEYSRPKDKAMSTFTVWQRGFLPKSRLKLRFKDSGRSRELAYPTKLGVACPI